MTAEVLAFPPARRRAYVRRQATLIAGHSVDGGRRYLQQQLEIQQQSLACKGVEPEAVAKAIAELEAVISAEVGRLAMSGGAA